MTQIPGGNDMNTIVEALRPLSAMPAAISSMTNELRAIRALLGGNTTGAQDPNARAAALGHAGGAVTPLAGQTASLPVGSGGGSIPASASGGTVLTPQVGPPAGGVTMAPGGGTAPVPSTVPAPGTPIPPGGPGSAAPVGGSGSPGAVNSALAGMTQASGDGIVNRAYGFITKKMPLLSIPNSIRNEYQSQINKNNYYVGMAGGDQSDAFGYRFGEEKARFQYGRLFNEEEARTAYKGTIAQGYNRGGDAREGRASQKEVMDAMYAGKERAGVTPEEMLTYTGTAARTATQDMQGLVDTLDNLGEAVGRAGGNAQQARAQFDRAWNQGISGGMTGAAAQSMASAASQANAQLGPQFANSNPMARISGDAQYQYIVGAQMGMNSGQFTSAMSNDPLSVANAQSQTFVQYMGSYISSNNPEGWAWLQSEVTSGSRDIGIIAEDFVSNHFGNMDRNAYVAIAQAFGPESSENLSDPMSVTRYLVKEMSGQTTGAMLAGEQSKIGAMDMSGNSLSQKGLKGTDKSMKERIGSNPMSASKAYTDLANKTGQRMGGIETLLEGMKYEDEKTQMVEVDASDGKRVVTLEQAIKYYPNQIQSGLARFVGGELGGKNIADVAGGVDASAKQAGIDESMESHDTKSHGAVGRKSDDYYKDHPDEKGGKGWKGPRAQIDLSPRAAKFFQVTGYEDEDSSGEPRNNKNGTNGRQSGYDAYYSLYGG